MVYVNNTPKVALTLAVMSLFVNLCDIIRNSYASASPIVSIPVFGKLCIAVIAEKAPMTVYISCINYPAA